MSSSSTLFLGGSKYELDGGEGRSDMEIEFSSMLQISSYGREYGASGLDGKQNDAQAKRGWRSGVQLGWNPDRLVTKSSLDRGPERLNA